MTIGSVACPPGSHYVRSHLRRTKKGITRITAHCRTNPEGKEKLLYASNLRYIYSQSKKKYTKLAPIKGFKGFHEFDPMIQFWSDYWKDKGVLHKNVDPLIIKSLIAVESSFRPKIRTKLPNSSAAGLMQITETTLRILRGTPDRKGYVEVSDSSIFLENDERLDPLVNIATGIRWLGHKVKTSPKRNSKNVEEKIFAGFKYYHSWTKEGEDHANKVYRYYENTLKQ